MAEDFTEYVAMTVETKFKAAWVALHPTFRIIWENGKGAPAGETETCVEFSILDNEDDRKDLGDSARTHRYSGIVNINIYVPKGAGTRKTRQYIDEISAFFRDGDENDIKYRKIKYEKLGNIASHFVSNVSTECYYNKVYTD